MSHNKATPYVEPPDMRDIKEELMCWRDMNRVCGPDCVAYITNTEAALLAPEYKDASGTVLGWARCRSLVYDYRASKHLVILAEAAKELKGQGR